MSGNNDKTPPTKANTTLKEKELYSEIQSRTFGSLHHYSGKGDFAAWQLQMGALMIRVMEKGFTAESIETILKRGLDYTVLERRRQPQPELPFDEGG